MPEIFSNFSVTIYIYIYNRYSIIIYIYVNSLDVNISRHHSAEFLSSNRNFGLYH